MNLKNMPFITQGKTNLKYILIVVILAVIVGGGILLLTTEKESKLPELKPPEEIPKIGLNLKTTKLVTIPEDHMETLFLDKLFPGSRKAFFSPNGRVVVYEAYTINGKAVSYLDYYNESGKSLAVVNGEEGKAYDGIWDFRFSPDGIQLAYTAIEGNWKKPLSGKQFVVLNGKEGKAYDNISHPVFSPDGTQLVYVAYEVKQKKEFVVVNGKESKAYDQIEYPFFSQDGTKLAYEVIQNNKQFVVINEKEGKAYDRVTSLSLSPDGTKIIYEAIQNNKKFFVINKEETEIEVFDGVISSSVVLSPDSSKLAYVVKELIGEKDQYFVVVDGERGEVYDYIDYSSFKFSLDNKVVYVASRGGGWFGSDIGDVYYRGGEWFVVVDGKELKETSTSDNIKSINFSSDGRYLADYFYSEFEGTPPTEEMPGEPASYITGIAVYDLINDTYENSYYPIRPQGAIEKFIFNPQNSEERTYIDNSRGMPLSVATYIGGKEIKRTTQSRVREIYYSPDGKGLMYLLGKSIEKKDKEAIAVNEKEGKAYDEIWSPNFTSDSKYVTYGARDGNELWWIVEEVE